MYPAGEAPGQYSVFNEEKQARNPVYTFGWVVSRLELFKAFYGKPPVVKYSLTLVENRANERFFGVWTEKGYDVNEYKWIFDLS